VARKSAISRRKPGASVRIIQKIADTGNKVGTVKVLHHWKHVHIQRFVFEKRHDLIVYVMHRLTVNHVVHGVRLRIDRLQMAVRSKNLQPGGK